MPKLIAPASATYAGELTTPDRWDHWVPRDGDVLVCTPPKSGTTWTQTMISMLLNQGTTLPGPLGQISPWIDADFGQTIDEVIAVLDAQPARRVIKTHTPADGLPIYDGVTVVAVYRHPLDVFLSLRRQVLNRNTGKDHPLRAPMPEALTHFTTGSMDRANFDVDTLENVVHHYRETALTGRVPGLVLLHYADMTRAPRDTLQALAKAIDAPADAALIDEIADATTLGSMRASAASFAPAGGTGFFKDDAAFFSTGGTNNWRNEIPDQDLARFEDRLRELLPDEAARQWLLQGSEPSAAV